MWEKMGYLVLGGLIAGQLLIGYNFVLGEAVYIATDCLMVFRNFKLKRPASDKIKDVILTMLAGLAIVINIAS